MGKIRLLGAVTPLDASRERARLVAAFEQGDGCVPRWTYASWEHEALRRALEGMANEIERQSGKAHAIAGVYAARARELALEAQLVTHAGKSSLSALARLRFAPGGDRGAASHLAHSWLAESPGAHPSLKMTLSDAADVSSLLGQMREAVGRLRLPFTVTAEPSLASLAATGERTILVAVGRPVSTHDIARTVLHEIEAHARPRTRAREILPRIFRLGTARGTDEQEGLALVLEERHGFLSTRRRRELAARHVVVEGMLDGASFVEGVRALVRDHGIETRQAVLVAERAYRGGNGETAGLGREIVYLESFLRVRRAIAARPSDEHVFGSGQVATATLAALRPFVSNSVD